jgi:hypothetical protein
LNKFKVNDKVRCAKYGQGVIIGIINKSHINYPIKVQFYSQSIIYTYSVNGLHTIYNPNPKMTIYKVKYINTRYNKLKGCYV